MNKKEQFFIEKTIEHKALVCEALLRLMDNPVIYKKLDKEQRRTLCQNIAKHDNSKFSSLELSPYAHYWYANENKKRITNNVQNKYNIAKKIHATTNAHHPEVFLYRIPEQDIDYIATTECVCDLQAMSWKKGESDCFYYWRNTWCFSYGGWMVKEVEEFMYDLIQVFRRKV